MRKKAKGPLDKYKNWIGMGLVIVVFVVVLLIAGKPSQPKSKPSTKKSSSEESRKPRGSGKRKRRSREEKLAEKARKKLERERRREERRGRESRSDRSDRSGRTSRELRTSSRRQSEAGYTLKGIFTDEKGVKYALIGERRARSGDVVAGRRIRDVQSDRVSVEYGGSNYEVRIGNSLF